MFENEGEKFEQDKVILRGVIHQSQYLAALKALVAAHLPRAEEEEPCTAAEQGLSGMIQRGKARMLQQSLTI